MAWTKTYSGAEPMRVNKWLATEGVCSRREADTLIEKGLVKIDGNVLTEAGYKIEDGQTLTLTDAARKAIAEEGWDPSFGARPLKRVIQQRIENALASRLLAGEVSENDRVTVDSQGRSFVFEVEGASKGMKDGK